MTEPTTSLAESPLIRSSSLVALASIIGGSRRGARALRAAAVATTLTEVGVHAYRRVRVHLADSTRYTVTLDSLDAIYDDVLAWVLDHMPSAEQRSMTIRTTSADRYALVDSPGPVRRNGKKVARRYDGKRTVHTTLAGHPISVEIERDAGTNTTNMSETGRRYASRERIVFTATTVAGRDAVIDFVERLVDAAETRPPMLFLADRWGDWNRADQAIAARPLSSVVLADAAAETIDADLGAFLAAESRYINLGIPWHRGYVFHGPPGTGKTSIARALAHSHGLDVYYLALSDVRDEENLSRLFGRISARSVVVIEDVDVVSAARNRDADQRGVTTSGILNALDGFVTPHGLVTFLTTNRLDVIDPALLRPGRADVILEFGYCDADQFNRLVAVMFPGRFGIDTGLAPHFHIDPGAQITPADVVAVAKATLDAGPEETIEALADLPGVSCTVLLS